MTKTTTTADGRKEALADWRAIHFDELNKTLNVLKKVRDGEYDDQRSCPHCKGIITWRHGSQKDIIEACKGIFRSLDALAPEKQTSQANLRKEVFKKTVKPELSQALKQKLDNLANRKPL